MSSRRILIFILIILALSLISILYPKLTHPITKNYYLTEQAILERVIDGDTIEAKVGNETWKIRLLGINTPEKNMPQYQQATDFLKQFQGKSITLLRDKEDTDKYNRKLRYIFFNDRFLNKEILQNGLANSYYTQDLIYERELLAAEKQAKQNSLGIWNKSEKLCATSHCIKLQELNYTNEFFILKNSCTFSCNMDGWFVKDSGRNVFYLQSMKSAEEKTYYSTLTKAKTDIWQNHDHFFLFDDQGYLVLYYEY